MKKDIQRGEGCNCDVLQESAEKDSTHVKRVSPMDTKARQMKSADELGIDTRREKHTSRKRMEVKPL